LIDSIVVVSGLDDDGTQPLYKDGKNTKIKLKIHAVNPALQAPNDVMVTSGR
jgi:hypothetical protein